MNLRYLHYLRLVVDHGSFSAAARAAGVSQPAISHGMRQLATAFDAPLFTRQGRRLLPTGTALRAALGGTELAVRLEAVTAAPAPLDRDTLRVGVTPSAALVCGPALYAGWRRDQPRRRLDLSSADEGRMLSRLQGGELDLVISPMPRGRVAAGLASEALYQITPQAYARRTHPLAEATSLTALRDAAWAIVGPSVSGPVDVLKEAFAVRKMPAPRVAVSCPDYASLLRLMAQHDLLGVLPHPSLLDAARRGRDDDAIVPLRLREALPRYEMHLFTPARPRSALQAVVAGLRQHVAARSTTLPSPTRGRG